MKDQGEKDRIDGLAKFSTDQWYAVRTVIAECTTTECEVEHQYSISGNQYLVSGNLLAANRSASTTEERDVPRIHRVVTRG